VCGAKDASATTKCLEKDTEDALRARIASCYRVRALYTRTRSRGKGSRREESRRARLGDSSLSYTTCTVRKGSRRGRKPSTSATQASYNTSTRSTIVQSAAIGHDILRPLPSRLHASSNSRIKSVEIARCICIVHLQGHSYILPRGQRHAPSVQ